MVLHHGKALQQMLSEKGVTVEQLMTLLKCNRAAVQRLYRQSAIDQSILRTIESLTGIQLLKLMGTDNPADTGTQTGTDERMSEGEFAEVFLVEDSELDAHIFKLTFEKAAKARKLLVFLNGKSAIDKLLELFINSPEHLPSHIFLDLKMPVMDGAQFLENFYRLNLDPDHKIKTHVLTSSVFYSERQTFTRHPLVTSFISKPVNTAIISSIFN